MSGYNVINKAANHCHPEGALATEGSNKNRFFAGAQNDNIANAMDYAKVSLSGGLKNAKALNTCVSAR